MALLEKDKRKFRVIIGSKKCGMCYGTSPSLAAKKVKEKSGAFYLKEITKDSKKKLYGPYSSKKGVVQRGGELKENKIREQICEDILEILKKCDNLEILTETQQVYNETYKVLENSYIFLDIPYRRDKCSCLRSIIGTRDGYRFKDGRHFPLGHCLCYLNPREQNAIEIGCFVGIAEILSQYSMSYSKNKNIYYDRHWKKFIEFLRSIIDIIQNKRTENEKRRTENKKKRENLRRRLVNFNKIGELQTRAELDQLKKDLEEAKAFHAAQEAGPAEEKTKNSNIGKPKRPSPYLLSNNDLANLPTNLSKIPQHMLQAIRLPQARGGPVNKNQTQNRQVQPLKRNGSSENNLAAAIRQADINRNVFLKKFAELNN